MIKIKKRLLLIIQQFWLSFEFFGKNGLANHAAAGAYGFLLSSAPVLLVISFFITNILLRSPELAIGMFEQINFLSEFLNPGEFLQDFLGSANPGFAGIISLIPVFWATRLCAQSMQRGLGVIFPEKKIQSDQNSVSRQRSTSIFGPFRGAVVTFGLGFLIITFIFVMLLGSTLALDFFGAMDFPLAASLYSIIYVLSAGDLSLAFLFLLVLVSYRFVPVNHPKWKNVIPGALTCMVFYVLFILIFSLIISPDRYNLLYGALGSLFLFLLNVYFFFYFFLFGASFIMVQGASNALLFIRFRQHHNKDLSSKRKLLDNLFASVPWPLEKYISEFKEGDLVFARGSMDREVYYVLTGKAGVYLDDECLQRIAFIEEKHFFGELEFVVEEGRSASIKAETDLLVIVLPRVLYRQILQIDPDTDRSIIQGLSERLKSSNMRVL